MGTRNIRRRPGSQTVGGVAGIAGVILTLLGLSALGDTPDPHDPAESLAAYFVKHRDAMFASMTLVTVGGIAVIIFLAVLRTRLGDDVARAVAFTAGVGIVTLLLLNELIYSALAFSIGRDDPATAKSLFALTILSSVLLSALVALLLGTVGARPGVLPRWFAYLSFAGAVLVLPGLVSFNDTGFLYPDVQQQVVAQVFLVWLIVASVVVWRDPGRARTS